MYDLTEFYRARIEALSNQRAKDEKTIVMLATLIYELCDKDCPDAYKEIALGEASKALIDD